MYFLWELLAPRALLGGPNFLAGLHLLLSFLFGVASTAWRWAIDLLVPLEGAREFRGARGGSLLLDSEEESVACAHGELGRDTRGGAPRQRHLSPELVAAAPRNAIKNPNWFLKLRITLGPMIASWRRVRKLHWTHLRASITRGSWAPACWTGAPLETAAQLTFVRGEELTGRSEHACGSCESLTRGHNTPPAKKEFHRFAPKSCRRDRNARS